MRMPNGYGSVTKLSGKRRKPYVITITEGWTDEAKQIRKIIGYAKTKKEGLQMLADYHNKPFDIDNSKLTFSELYEKWLPFKQRENLSKKGLQRYTNAYKYYSKLYNVKFIDISLSMLQSTIDECPHGYDTKNDIKMLFLQMFKYAKLIELPLIKNVGEYVLLPQKQDSKIHKPFSEEEIDILWKNSDFDIVKIILLLIYTGIRPNELSKISEIHQNYFVTGSKTKSGMNRIIPLHNKIIPIFKQIIDSNLYKIPYSTLRANFVKTISALSMEHKVYDCRHTFATRMNNVHADELITKLILGHKIKDITKKVYVHNNLEQLIKEVNLLR